MPGTDGEQQAAELVGGHRDEAAAAGIGTTPGATTLVATMPLVATSKTAPSRRAHRDGGVEGERPARRRRAARFGPREEGQEPADASCHAIIVAGNRRDGIRRDAYPRLHRKDDGPPRVSRFR